jgi:hypothetical protein
MENPCRSDEVEKASWQGCIPVMLSLSPMSLSSPTMPAPVHKLIPRHSYLHLALEEEVRNFHQHAPILFRPMGQKDGGDGIVTSTIQSDNEDNDSSQNHEGAIDTPENESLNQNKNAQQSASDLKENPPYPICWFEDERTGTPLRWQLFIGILHDLLRLRKSTSCTESYQHLPWKIRIHFTAYPETLLPLSISEKHDVLRCIFQHYLNSLKQSLYLQHNSARTAKNLNKQSHVHLWNGIMNNKWEGSFREISMELDGNGNGNGTQEPFLNNVPIRIMVDGRPTFSRPCNPRSADGEQLTIGHVLREWLPGLFEKQLHWCVQGIVVPLECPVAELWRVLCHPDRFLYILVVVDDLHIDTLCSE